MPGWNFADVWELAVEERGDSDAAVHGDRRLTFAEVGRRADGVATALLEVGVEHQDKVAQYLYNGPEYLESVFAAFKIGLVPVNTNYRYGADELVYLWDNADAVAVVFHGTFSERIDEIRARVPKVRLWLWIDDGSGPCPGWALPYEQAAGALAAPAHVRAPWGRSGEDILMLYTGGTTGMPKGVMWRQHDLYGFFSDQTLHDPAEPGLEAATARLRGRPIPPALPACPLMHGTGAFTAYTAWAQAAAVVTMTSRRYDAVELLDAVEHERVSLIAIVGDVFARPMLEALDAEPGRWDISSLFAILSSGVMWSENVKQGLLRHHPDMFLVDAFSSSEAIGIGMSVSSGRSTADTATFQLSERARIITEDGGDVAPGSGEVGLLAIRGRCPVGYYKDPEKSARTFRVIDGETYSVPGDWATVAADGTARLLGRGSVCINTGGEKVFPEEVEEVLKEHPAVGDAVVVGVPHDRWGEAVCAIVRAAPGANVDEAELIAHVKGRLASYKAPQRVLEVDDLGRSPAGKVDYARLRQVAVDALG